MNELDNLKNKSTHGGKRDGAGRKLGSLNKATLEQKKVLDELKKRIMYSADSLFNAAKSAAIGNQFLYKIVTETDSKGNKRKLPAEIVKNEVEIADVLDQMDDMGYYQDENEDTYYFMSTKAPDIRAFNSLLDRAFGKPTENIEANIKIKPVPIYGGQSRETIQVQEHDSDKEDIQSEEEN